MGFQRRILVVEDDEGDLELTLRALGSQRLAHQIDVVRDGEEAMEYLEQKGRFQKRPPGLPALVLLDIKLPKMDGLEILKKIKGSKVLRYIPVVMLTSSKEQRDLHESYETGANAYVVKPIAYREYVDSIMHLGKFWTDLNVVPERLGTTSSVA